MFTVTEGARARLARKLDRRNAAPNLVLRCITEGPQLKFTVGQPTDADVLFTYKGRTVLAVDKASSTALRNMLLDVRETEAGPRLSLRCVSGPTPPS